LVRAELGRLAVPVVITGTSSVFASEAARDWLTFLTALEQPHRPGLMRAAALTHFVGWSAADLDGASDEQLDLHAARLRSWADVLRRRGVAALLEAVMASTDLAARVLAHHGGERLLTDLRHVGQLLHVEA